MEVLWHRTVVERDRTGEPEPSRSRSAHAMEERLARIRNARPDSMARKGIKSVALTVFGAWDSWVFLVFWSLADMTGIGAGHGRTTTDP